MHADFSQNPEHIQRLCAELGVSTFHYPCKWISAVSADGELMSIFAFHSFGPNGCEMSAAIFRNALMPRSVRREIFGYPFVQLGLGRVTCVTRTTNVRSQRIVSRMGFRVEGLLRNWYPDCHGILHGLLKEECKWL